MQFIEILPEKITSPPAPLLTVEGSNTTFPSPNRRGIRGEVEQFCQEWHSGQQNFERQTSGSTGKPKTIGLTRQQMVASAKATQKALNLRAGQTSLVCLNVNFIAGTMMLVRAMEIGQRMLVVEPDSNPLAKIPDTETIDFMAVVPLQLETMLAAGLAHRLNAMQCIIVGGAAVHGLLVEKIQALAVPIYSTYGMTETVSHVALQRLNGLEKEDCYTLIEGIEAKTDHRGCLCLCGEVSNNKWLITNDLIEWVSPRKFKVLGRADNVINSGGIKISLEKVERAIERLALPQRSYCWHKPDERLGQRLVWVVEGTEEPNLLEKHKPVLAEQLLHYEIPKEIVFLEKFEETATGKVVRRL